MLKPSRKSLFLINVLKNFEPSIDTLKICCLSPPTHLLSFTVFARKGSAITTCSQHQNDKLQ